MSEFRFVDEQKRVVEHIPTKARFYIYPTIEIADDSWVAGQRTPWGREYVLEDVKADVQRFLELQGLAQ